MMPETHTIASNLLALLETTAPKLKRITNEKARYKSSPSAWSAKELLGHLLDSAVNNHQRFIKAQQLDEYEVATYNQLFWVNSQNYNDSDWLELIDLWNLYNRHLARVIRAIPEGK